MWAWLGCYSGIKLVFYDYITHTILFPYLSLFFLWALEEGLQEGPGYVGPTPGPTGGPE